MDALGMQTKRTDGCMQRDALAYHATVKGATAAFELLRLASCLDLSTSMHSHVDQT